MGWTYPAANHYGYAQLDKLHCLAIQEGEAVCRSGLVWYLEVFGEVSECTVARWLEGEEEARWSGGLKYRIFFTCLLWREF